jgi:hypothetical protein
VSIQLKFGPDAISQTHVAFPDLSKPVPTLSHSEVSGYLIQLGTGCPIEHFDQGFRVYSHRFERCAGIPDPRCARHGFFCNALNVGFITSTVWGCHVVGSLVTVI